MTTFKKGQFVRTLRKSRWYGLVFDVEQRKGDAQWVVLATVCTADGRPHQPMRKRMKCHHLEVVDRLPERFDGPLPTELPDRGLPGGTLKKKFSDHFSLGDDVWVIRYEHGWDVGEGKISSIGPDHCRVRLDSGGEIDIDHVRDLARC